MRGRRLAVVVLAPLGMLLLGPLALLVVVAETRAGRLLGVAAALGLLAIGAAAAGGWARGRPWAWVIAGTSALASLAVVVVIVVLDRGPGPPPGIDGLRAWRVGGGPVRRGWLDAILPEGDLVRLGSELGTRLVPMVGRARGRLLRETVRRLDSQLAADPTARALPSAFATVAAGREGTYLAYVPPHAPGERLGAIVFLHGNGGNFRLLPWAWKPFADRHRIAVVCPTFGLGFWGRGGAEAVESVRLDALRRFPIDPARTWLGGISDGGVGVTRTAAARPDRYRGLIYLSPTMHLDELSAPAFARAWEGRPILVLQGGRDRNVRPETVAPAVELLRRQGGDVTYHSLPEEDHALFFVRAGEVGGWVGQWMREERSDFREE